VRAYWQNREAEPETLAQQLGAPLE
jgi:hypothetical protein